MATVIEQAVRDLLAIVKKLHDEYPPKEFTLDGRLIGDIGETLVARDYDVELHKNIKKHYDAITTDGLRHVQIKATMKELLTFPRDHVPDFYVGIKIHSDGTFTEVFNGPGASVQKLIKDRKRPAANLHSLSVSALEALNAEVDGKDRILLRSGVASKNSN